MRPSAAFVLTCVLMLGGSPALGYNLFEIESGDPVDIRSVINAVNSYKKWVAAGDDLLKPLARQELVRELILSPSAESRGSVKFAGLLAAFRALDKQLATRLGGRALATLGSGKMVTTIDEDAMERVAEAIRHCQQFNIGRTGTNDREQLDQVYAKYEAALGKALKRDPDALFYVTRDRDVRLEITHCEQIYQVVGMRYDDTLPFSSGGDHEIRKGCGFFEVSLKALRRVKRRAARGRWEDATGGDDAGGVAGTAASCRTLPRRTRVPADIKKALRREGYLTRGRVAVMDGRPELHRDDDSPWLVYKWANVKVFGKKLPVRTSACGETSSTVVCAASGSQTARAYDQLVFYRKRAELHKGAGRGERCKQMLKLAAKAADEWRSFAEEARSKKEWKAGLKYKTLDGILAEKTVLAMIPKLGSDADEREARGWCR